MTFMYRYRRPISIVALAALLFTTTAEPALAVYNPKVGRFMQRDPVGTALVMSPGLRSQGSNPTVTVSLDYQLQYADGMNFYNYLRSNPVGGRDPSGLFSLIEVGGANGIQSDMWSMYLDTGTSTIDALKGVSMMQMERYSAIDDVVGAVSSGDWSDIDTGLAMYQDYQRFQLGLFLGGAGIAVARGVIGIGKRAFKYFAERAGGRHALLDTLRSGMNRIRRLFRFDGIGPGKWVRKARGGQMDDAARAYQRQITGRIDEEYLVNGVHFDGFAKGTLIDAKDWQGARKFIDESSGRFYKWFGDAQIPGALRQIDASGRYGVQWHVADREVANAFSVLFREKNVKIDVVWTPRWP